MRRRIRLLRSSGGGGNEEANSVEIRKHKINNTTINTAIEYKVMVTEKGGFDISIREADGAGVAVE